MYVVEIDRDGDELAEPMAEIRTWLDHRHIEPSVFRLSLLPGGTIFRLEFRVANEGEAFARAFAGQAVAGEGLS